MLAKAVAHALTDRPVRKGSAWGVPCPAHGGSKPSCNISDGDRGGLILVCHSRGCSYHSIEQALIERGLATRSEHTYPDGRVVTRTNHRGGGKDIRQTSNARAGSSAGSPALVSGPADSVVVVVEGEKAFNAILSAGLAAACWRGGSDAVDKASFTELAGRRVVIWPDADDPGAKAAEIAAQRIHAVGAATIAILPSLGAANSGDDAADVTTAELLAHVEAGGPAWLPPPQTVFEAKNALALDGALASLHYALRLNERAARLEVLAPGDHVWREWDDPHEAYLRETVADQFTYITLRSGPRPLRFGKDAWGDAINAIIHNRRVDPFVEWYETRPPWDGEPRLEFMLSELFDAPPDKLTQWASRTTLIGAIVRARDPGATLDEIPILLGPQGIGKSKLWPSLLPAEHRKDWFSDEMDFGGRKKDQIEATLGRVIVEAGELAGLAGSDIERLKTYLTRTNDGSIRLAYAHRPYAILRRFVIVGTTNDDHCLPNDPSGNRRFVIVHCPRNRMDAAVETWAERNRDQLWAEAIAMANDGDDARLPRTLIAERDKRNETHRSANETVESAVAKFQPPIDNLGRTMLELIDSLPADDLGRQLLERTHENAIGRALKLSGWTAARRRRNGRPLRLWFSPRED